MLISTNQVSNEQANSQPIPGFRWEPSSASGDTWATSWATFSTDKASWTQYVSAWSDTDHLWLPPTSMSPAPNSLNVGDFNLAWDAGRSRFVFVTLDSGDNVWYGYSNSTTSTNPAGTSWSYASVTPFPRNVGAWDYPSIAVDASDRVILGAVALGSAYYVSVSIDGEAFPASPTSTNVLGTGGRVVAAGSTFHLFVPVTNFTDTPTEIDHYQSFDGLTWVEAVPKVIATCNSPWDSSTTGTPIYYAPDHLAASGYSNGLWAVAFQINASVNGNPYNSAYICTSDRGCGLLTGGAVDEFMVSVSVSGDSGYWVSYYVNDRQSPLSTQTLYLPQGQFPIAANPNSGIDATSWLPRGDRCPNRSCFAAGDFNTISSNSFAGSHQPFIKQTSFQNGLFQNFLQDPQSTANIANFKPNFIPFPLGAHLESLGVPIPANAIGAAALPPSKKAGVTLHATP